MHVVFKTLGELDAPLGGSAHQMNSAARRFRLQTQRAVGRALIQAEAAVDALVEFGKVKRSIHLVRREILP